MSISTTDHRALTLLREEPTRFADQGTVVETWRTYRGRRLGPYYRLAWRENGRQRSIYLGRQGPVVRQVRILLHQAHTQRRIRRQARLRATQFRKDVSRPIRQYIKEIFRLFGNGLYIKGSEIRGIRTAGPRLTIADVPKHLIPEFPFPLPSFLTDLHTNTHTNPTRERGQETPSPKSAWHYGIPEFPESVDQNHPRTTRGPPTQPTSETAQVPKRSRDQREQTISARAALPRCTTSFSRRREPRYVIPAKAGIQIMNCT